MSVKDYGFLMSHLKIHVSKKSYFFDLYITNPTKPFLLLLKSLGFVRGFRRLNGPIYRVFPNWNSDKSTLKRVRFFQKKTHIPVSLRLLKIFKTYSSNSNLILHTPLGLMTHHKALQKGQGGLLVCIIL